MTRPHDISQEAWGAAGDLWEALSVAFQSRDEETAIIARAIMAAKAEEREACAVYLDECGSNFYVDCDDKRSQFLCEDLAHELRKCGEA